MILTVITVDCFSQDILRTDSTGKILGGDGNDWSFDRENYEKNVLGKVIFKTIKKQSIEIPAVPAFNCETNSQGVLIKWTIIPESSFKGFIVERVNVYIDSVDSEWKYIGYVKAKKTKGIVDYEFLDRDVEKYNVYSYRLKAENSNGDIEYLNAAPAFVYPDIGSELYPVYPNPVDDIFYITFYLNEKDMVSIYFLKGNKKINIMSKEGQEKGLYQIYLRKDKFPFSNETVKLYMECGSCGDGYQGDVEFK